MSKRKTKKKSFKIIIGVILLTFTVFIVVFLLRSKMTNNLILRTTEVAPLEKIKGGDSLNNFVADQKEVSPLKKTIKKSIDETKTTELIKVPPLEK